MATAPPAIAATSAVEKVVSSATSSAVAFVGGVVVVGGDVVGGDGVVGGDVVVGADVVVGQGALLQLAVSDKDPHALPPF